MGRWRAHDERRTAIIVGVLALIGFVDCARGQEGRDTGPTVRMTVEITWDWPELPDLPNGPPPDNPPIELEATAGKVLDVVAWPRPLLGGPLRSEDGTWRLGTARSGLVRARLEVPLSSSLMVWAGNHATAFPITAVIEAPQQSAPGAPAALGMRRLAWDALEVELGKPVAEGIVAPGAVVPVTVGFNFLTPEPAEGVLRILGELRPARGGDPVWRCDQTQRFASDPAPGQVPMIVLQMPAPTREGTYILELRSFWGPIASAESSRFSRLIRRRRTPGPIQAARRVSLAVLSPDATRPAPVPISPSAPPDSATVVDSIDLARIRASRPMTSGRTPASHPWPLPEEVFLRSNELGVGDRLRGLVGLGPDTATLGAGDASSLSWVALGLKVPHPGRPHRLTVNLAAGDPAACGVALVSPADETTGHPPRVLLDAVMAGESSAAAPAASSSSTGSWLVWPDSPEPSVVLVHRGGGAGPIRLGSVVLEEWSADPPSIPSPPAPDAVRNVGLVVSHRRDLDRFGPQQDPLAIAQRLATYLAHCGASMAVLPESLHDRDRRRALDGQADEDPTGPDRLALTLRVLQDRQLQALVGLSCDGPLPDLLDATDPRALAQGLVPVNGRGQAETLRYNPLNRDVREALARHARNVLALRESRPNLVGLLIRLGPGATLAGAPDSGLDDAGYARFLATMLDPAEARKAPGRDPAGPERFAQRAAYVLGPGRTPWLSWRARELGTLYTELAAAVDQAAPGAMLAIATPTLDDGPAGIEARRADSQGELPLTAWQALGLDFAQWKTPPANLVVLRGIAFDAEPLARDLATHPDLDASLARLPRRGLLWTGADAEPDESPALRAGTANDEPLGHALAVLDAHVVLLSIATVAGREERLAAFARVVRALPATPPASLTLRPETGIAARFWSHGNETILSLANDTPYPIRLDTPVHVAAAESPLQELGRGVRLQPSAATAGQTPTLAVELPPFGVAALRLPAPDAALPLTLHPPEEVMRAQYQLLSTHLSRLAQGGGSGGLPNPSFEPLARETGIVRTATSTGVPGWSTGKGATAQLDPNRPHGGSSSLRLDATAAPGAVASEPFVPPGGTTLLLTCWLRAEAAGTPVQVWFEGDAEGRNLVRRAEIRVGPDWSEHQIQLSNLPGAGLDRLRLRFQLTTPGKLWVDDLTLTGQRLSEPDRRAQRTLTAAMQKFRERRFADFARLASSYWAHSSATAELVRTGSTAGGDNPKDRRIR